MARRDDVLARLLIVFGLTVFFAVRIATATQEFINNDVAGIAYEADTLLRGELPYKDTVQNKPPGAFFVFAAVFGLVARDLRALHVVLGLWLLFGGLGVYRAAFALYGTRLSAASATSVYLLYVGFFELNYSSWMGPAYTWAFAALVIGIQTRSVRWNLAAGAFATVAFLFKQPAAVLAPLAMTLWLHVRRKGEPGASAAAVALWLAGAAIAVLPLLLFYAARGGLGELLHGVLAWGAYKEHVSDVTTKTPGFAGLAFIVFSQLFRLFPLAVFLSCLTFAGSLWQVARRQPVTTLLPALALLFWSLVGGAMSGFRFYSHYSIQYLPALALLAAHPSGLVGLFRETKPRWPGWAASALTVLLSAQHVYLLFVQPDRVFDRRLPLLSDGSSAARRAGEYIRARTRVTDTIYVWGWLGWPVYFWSERRAPLAAYRELGRVTSFNSNTHWSPSQPFSFVPGKAADDLVHAFEHARPAYFVYSPYYIWESGGGPEPLLQFTDLLEVLRRDYELEARYGELSVYGRKDRRR